MIFCGLCILDSGAENRFLRIIVQIKLGCYLALYCLGQGIKQPKRFAYAGFVGYNGQVYKTIGVKIRSRDVLLAVEKISISSSDVYSK